MEMLDINDFKNFKNFIENNNTISDDCPIIGYNNCHYIYHVYINLLYIIDKNIEFVDRIL